MSNNYQDLKVDPAQLLKIKWLENHFMSESQALGETIFAHLPRP